MRGLLQRPDVTWIIPAVAAAAMLVGALLLPLWRLELVAPQYPAGLIMHAYGYKFTDDSSSYYDDVREINGLNHYIGMKPLEEVLEMQLFIPGVLALMAATFVAAAVRWQGKWVRRLIVAGYWFMPLFFVADLQFWLYHYGHSMNPEAALNTGDFTPKVIGTTKVWNFHSQTSFEMGFYLMILAAVTMTFGPWLVSRAMSSLGLRRGDARVGAGAGRTSVAAIVILAATAGIIAAVYGADAAEAGEAGADGQTLQQRIDAAAPEDIIIVEGGTFHERIHIDKPLSLIGHGWPVIDGDGQGDVVTIAADDVHVSGFEVRGSGRSISREPAAIKIIDADRAQLTGNRVRDAHAAIHVTDSTGTMIRANDLRPGSEVPQERRGHGIYLWQVTDSTVLENTVADAADGIHLEFADGNLIVRNTVTDSRYALHFMYANRNRIVNNQFTHNLSGAVLMFSHELILVNNELSSNRDGSTGAGLLLKDTDNFFAQGNRILRNKYGLTAEGAPQSVGATAVLRGNLFGLNDVGVALTSSSPITFVENAVIDNTIAVKSLSGTSSLGTHGAIASTGGDGTLPEGAVWSSNGRGNYWSDYRGYDADGDGVGDQPYLPRPAFAGALADSENLRVFQFTPAQQAIDLAADLFPLYRYDAVIEDAHPLMSPPAGTRLSESERFNRELVVVSAVLVVFSASVVLAATGVRLPRRVRVRAEGFAAGGMS
jgi:nitrous oxidase accessory protein